MRRKLIALGLALLMLISVLPPGLAAEAPGKVVFESGQADANGVFEVTVKAYDLSFRGFQFTVRYDPTVVQAVDQAGKRAEKFNDFAVLNATWMMTAGTELKPDMGMIDFTCFTLPRTKGEHFNAEGEVVADSDGMLIYTFRFKRLKDGDAEFQIATKEKGEPYRQANPKGVILKGNKGNLEADIIFRDAEGDKSESLKADERDNKTVNGLLKEAVILKIGSHAAAVAGNVVALYPGEPMVTAYAHDNRTFVPVRFVAERLGATVDWVNESQTVIVEKDGHRIEMAIGSATYTLDGEEKTLDAPAELTPSDDGNSRTMVPIRFVSEALGYQVEWDQPRNLVIIAPKTLNWEPQGAVEGQAMDQVTAAIAMFGNFV